MEAFRRRALAGDNFAWRVLIGLVLCAGGDIFLTLTATKLGFGWWLVRFVLGVMFACFVIVGVLTAYKRAVEYRAGYWDGRLSMTNAMREAHERGMNPYQAVEREMMRDLARSGIPMEQLDDALSAWHAEHDQRDA
jgi:hypothetical protein